MNAAMKDQTPALMFSAPRLGPTTTSSIIFAGAGRDPAFNNPAKSFASIICLSRLSPEPNVITDFPFGISSFTEGAE